MEDPRLVTHLREAAIALEVCPTSNVRTRQVADMPQHPLPRLIDEGLTVTVNSDDPPMFGTTLTSEYQTVASTFGLDRAALARLAANAVEASFMSQQDKRLLLEEIARL